MGTPKTVLFLCPHGGAKSVLAAAYLNRLATARGLSFVALACAVDEPYDAVPRPVAELLEREALGPGSFRPRRVESADLLGATRVVSIDCDTASVESPGVPIERWDDVPRVDDDLPGAAAAIRTHVERLVDQLQSDRGPEAWASFLGAMGRIALNSFGGPVAQIAFVHDEVVERRKWIDDATFGRLLSFANALPGPEALELVIHVGYLRRGVAGGIVAGLLFVAPGVASLTLLAWLYAQYGSTPLSLAIQGAIRPVAVALVIAAALRLSRKLLQTATGFSIAAAALLAGHFFAAPFMVVLISGAVLGVALPRGRPLENRRRAVVAAALVVVAVAVGAAPARFPADATRSASAAAPPSGATLAEVASFNLKTALVTFGGAYTALPYMREQAVDRFRWLSDEAMLDALALGETTPGPLISIGVFVSYLAGGLPGALVGAFFLFLPSFVLVLTLARHVEKILSAPGVARGLGGVVAATIGFILAFTVDVVGRITGVVPALIAVGAFGAVSFLRASPALVVLVVTIGAIVAEAVVGR